MTDTQRAHLTDFGMTNQEVDLWFALSEVAGEFLRLPQLHPTEQRDTVADLHHLQNRLLARPGMRAQGWPRRAPLSPEAAASSSGAPHGSARRRAP
jgi:hypothetical protein